MDHRRIAMRARMDQALADNGGQLDLMIQTARGMLAHRDATEATLLLMGLITDRLGLDGADLDRLAADHPDIHAQYITTRHDAGKLAALLLANATMRLAQLPEPATLEQPEGS